MIKSQNHRRKFCFVPSSVVFIESPLFIPLHLGAYPILPGPQGTLPANKRKKLKSVSLAKGQLTVTHLNPKGVSVMVFSVILALHKVAFSSVEGSMKRVVHKGQKNSKAITMNHEGTKIINHVFIPFSTVQIILVIFRLFMFNCMKFS